MTEKDYVTLDKESCEQPVDLRKEERHSTDVHKRKTGCNFRERLVLLRNGLLFPFVFTEKALAKPGFICCENSERSRCWLKGALFRSLAVETV